MYFSTFRLLFARGDAAVVVYHYAIGMLYRDVEVRRFEGVDHVERTRVAQVNRSKFSQLSTFNFCRGRARYNAYAVGED